MIALYAAVGILAGCAVVALGVLTGVGARRRGAGRGPAVASGLLFPLAWVVWYHHDRLDEQQRARTTTAA